MTEEEKELWLQGAQEYGDAIEDRSLVPVMEEDEIDNTVSFPAVKYDRDPTLSGAKPQAYRQVFFKTFWNRITALGTTVTDSIASMLALRTSTEAARDAALAATENAEAATAKAENVNATLTGTTITVTDRNGTTHTTNVGFDIYGTFPSMAAMEANANLVPEGKFVVIATTDPTSEENAQMYVKNASGGFTFVSDLDQASSHAWADWVDNYRPVMVSDHETAQADHGTATADHSTAVKDHSTAQADHTEFATNEAQRQSTFETNEAARQSTFDSDEAQRQQDFEDAESERMAAMLITHFVVDPRTGHAHAITAEHDSTQYGIRSDGHLYATIQTD